MYSRVSAGLHGGMELLNTVKLTRQKAGLIDSQSAKTAGVEQKSFDAGKKRKGVKDQIVINEIGQRRLLPVRR